MAAGVPLPVVLPPDPVVLLVAANVNNRSKGMITALSALQRHLGRPFTLLTVGEPFPDFVLEEYGLADRTVQLGRLDDRPRLAAAYGLATITMVPSLAESFGLVAAESIACGTPVIASNAAALPHLVREGQTGFLAQGGDVTSFECKLRRVFNMSMKEYMELRDSCRQFARAHDVSFFLMAGCLHRRVRGHNRESSQTARMKIGLSRAHCLRAEPGNSRAKGYAESFHARLRADILIAAAFATFRWGQGLGGRDGECTHEGRWRLFGCQSRRQVTGGLAANLGGHGPVPRRPILQP
ncbi:MAG: glycosyltransferase [Thermoleophilia bacterium]